MTVKHTPATPLPWRSTSWSSHAASTVLIDDESTVLGRRVVADCEACEPRERERDAAYIAHAANAYPKLVAALKTITDRLDHRGLTLTLTRAHCNDLRDVLRELGEAA